MVYIAPNPAAAGKLKEALESHSLLVKLKSLKSISPGDEAVEILVPQSEAQEAYEIIGNHIKAN